MDLGQIHGAVFLVNPSAPEKGPLKGMPTRLSAVVYHGDCTGGQNRPAAGECQARAVSKSGGWTRVNKGPGRPGKLTGITTDLCTGETNLTLLKVSILWISLSPGWPSPSCAEHRTWAKQTPRPLHTSCKDNRWQQESSVLGIPEEGQLGK